MTNATINFLSMAYFEMQMRTVMQMAGGRMYVTWTRKWFRFVQNYCWYFADILYIYNIYIYVDK
jgi:hypothetical protein